MKLIYHSKYNLRTPFELKKHSLLSYVYYLGYGYDLKILGVDYMRGFRLLFRVLYKFIKSSKGAFYFTGNEKREIIFNARNTQFHSIYIDYMKYYETEMSVLMDILLEKDDVFFDIGSNWGHYSLFVASNETFEGKIFAFEPLLESFQDLESTVKQAQLQEIITCYNIALSDNNGEAYIKKPDNVHSGTATLLNSSKGIKIAQKKLDDMNLPSPDIVKIDVEGFEYFVLNGAEKVLKESKPFVFFESHKIDRPDTFKPFKYLKNLGYVFYYPMFFKNEYGYPVFNGQQNNIYADNNYKIGLWEFDIEERFFLPNLINVFACHVDKLSSLKKRIEHYA